MADFIISSLRGGVNNTDPPMSISDNQSTVAENVELYSALIGARRLGTDAIDLPAFLSGKDRIPFLFRHLPTSDETASELWALGVTGTSTAALGRKTTTWQAEVTMADAPTLTGFSPYQWTALSFHGKLFICYNSGVDRLHVWDGTTFRRVGLAEAPAAPTAADTAVAGSFTGVRYYRVRYTVRSGSVTLLRSEPSDALTFTPNGSFNGAIVTKPASISESETHWELEASTDNVNFYIIATTVVATTTVTDTEPYATNYATFELSEDIGDYTNLHSPRYIAADADRLVVGSSWEDADLESRITWTPVQNEPGNGNDERIQLDTDPFIDLDAGEGGGLTGLSNPVNGYMYAFKRKHIYRLVRTGQRSRAYEARALSKERGALHGSVVAGVDQTGAACLYFLDPNVGPCRIGRQGLESCGADIQETWRTLNQEASKVVCTGLYYTATRQVIWCIATGSTNIPNLGIILQTNEMRSLEDGARMGWTIWDGNRVKAISMCLYSDNIDNNGTRSRTLVPFIGLEGLGLIHRCETGDRDNGIAYSARIVTKPYTLGNFLDQFAVKNAVLVAKATDLAEVNVSVARDFGIETKLVEEIDLAAEGLEDQVIKVIPDLHFSELRTVQVEFTDSSAPGPWELNGLAMRIEKGQRSI